MSFNAEVLTSGESRGRFPHIAFLTSIVVGCLIWGTVARSVGFFLGGSVTFAFCLIIAGRNSLLQFWIGFIGAVLGNSFGWFFGSVVGIVGGFVAAQLLCEKFRFLPSHGIVTSDARPTAASQAPFPISPPSGSDTTGVGQSFLPRLISSTVQAKDLALAFAGKIRITQFTLPSAFVLLGTEIVSGGEHRERFSDLTGSIAGIDGRITLLKSEGGANVQCSGLRAKARAVLIQCFTSCQIAILKLKRRHFLRELGRRAFEVNCKSDTAQSVFDRISMHIAKRDALDSEISRLTTAPCGEYVTPKRLLVSIGYLGIMTLVFLLFDTSSRTQTDGREIADAGQLGSAEADEGSSPNAPTPSKDKPRSQIESKSSGPGILPLDGRRNARASEPHQQPEPNLDFADAKSDLDPVVDRLIGPVSNVYSENGYKGRMLDTTITELRREIPLKRVLTTNPAIFLNSPNEEFVFDDEQRLILYGRNYEGGADDYMDSLLELFGRTDKKFIKTSTNTANDGEWEFTTSTALYHFPKVLAKVIIRTNARAGGRRNQQTFVLVLSKPWAMKTLSKNVLNTRAHLKWLKDVTASLQLEEIEPDKWQKFEGTRLTDESNRGRWKRLVEIVDTDYEKKLGDKTPRLFSLGKFDDLLTNRKNVISMRFNFGCYSRNATAELFHARKWYDSANLAMYGNNALASITFGEELVDELHCQLAQEYFAPRSEKITLIRPPKNQMTAESLRGLPYYEWQTEKGWLIKTDRLGITVEIKEKKQL